MKRALLPALVMVGLAAILVFQLVTAGGIVCKVCITFEGQYQCAKARGDTRREAEHEAQSSACSLVARGVSNAMACPKLRPQSVACE